MNLANKLGIFLEWLPPTASELNPVERMWSYFKRRWRQKLYNPAYDINKENATLHIEKTLEDVSHLQDKLARGPLRHMQKWIKPNDW